MDARVGRELVAGAHPESIRMAEFAHKRAACRNQHVVRFEPDGVEARSSRAITSRPPPAP